MDAISPCEDHECVNTEGSYYCKCIDGLEFDASSEKNSDDELSQCVNINECEKRIHKCDSGRGWITHQWYGSIRWSNKGHRLESQRRIDNWISLKKELLIFGNFKCFSA